MSESNYEWNDDFIEDEIEYSHDKFDHMWIAKKNGESGSGYSKADAYNRLMEKLKEDDSAGLKVKPSPEADLADTSGMNDKAIRYIAWGIGSLAAFSLLFMNYYSFKEYGFFADEINQTLAFDMLRELARSFTRHGSSDWAYFLWHASLAGGIFISWKYRFKTGNLLGNILKRIHDRA